MIPKIIHYCWFGRGKYPKTIQKCIESWKKYCPDYTFMLWNEDNAPMDEPWIKETYALRQYAFVADYVRFWALYNYGGIYLDTDMLLIKPIDEFLSNTMFLGREDEKHASMGIIGMPERSEFCKVVLDYYSVLKFDINNVPIITVILTPKLEKFGYKYENITQTLSNGLTIYESSYFYPVHFHDKFEVQDLLTPPYGGFVKPNKPTYAIHLWNKSWADEWENFEKKNYSQAYSIVWHKIRKNPIQPLKYYKKILKYTFIMFGLYH